MRYRWLRYLALLAMAASCLAISPLAAQTNPVIFTRLSIPVGVATDAGGNVYVTSDRVTSTLITRFAPSGSVAWQIPVGDFTSITTIGRLAVDPGTGLLWDLFPDGRVAIINPDTAQGSIVLNLRELPIDVSAVFDIETRTTQAFGSLILTNFATYGDIALLRRGSQLDVFISGLSVTVPFVMRLRVVDNQIVSAAVIVSSLTTTAPNSNEPRGVAVSPQGLVLTALPRKGLAPTIYDRAVTFSADFPESAGAARPTVRFTNNPNFIGGETDFTGKGMAADERGNFYVATGTVGTTVCGTSGELAIISARFLRVSCSRIGGALTNSQDVAVDSARGFAYMSITSGPVVRFDVDPRAVEEHVAFLPALRR